MTGVGAPSPITHGSSTSQLPSARGFGTAGGGLLRPRSASFAGPEDDPTIAIDARDGVGPSIWFNRVPEGKNRVHLDVYGDVGALVARGPCCYSANQRVVVASTRIGDYHWRS